MEAMTITFINCRTCSGQFRYRSQHGGVVSIFAGLPTEVEYKAVSYVWGKVKDIGTYCTTCNTSCSIPMASVGRFERIMQLVGSGSTVWIDALSIDQASAVDKQLQIGQMGTIFKNARYVSVLLPETDLEAGKLLHDLTNIGRLLLHYEHSLFDAGYDGIGSQVPEDLCLEFETQCRSRGIDSVLEELSEHDRKFVLYSDEYNRHNVFSRVIWSFYQKLDHFRDNLGSWLYWKRAWTFQEWALASRIEVAVEQAGTNTMTYYTRDVKQIIINTTIMIAIYKLRNHEYCLKFGMDRGRTTDKVSMIRRLFPDEEVFIDNLEMPPQRYKDQCAFPGSNGIDLLLGLRIRPYRIESAQATLKRRLSIMLNARATCQRESRHEADLVASWASMCNVQYDYSTADSLLTSLRKAVSKIRASGINIYNFHSNTIGTCGQVDLTFHEYAAECRQGAFNLIVNDQFFHGAPAFSGRVDTAMHFGQALKAKRLSAAPHREGVRLQRITSGGELRAIGCQYLKEGFTLPTVDGPESGLTIADNRDLWRTIQNASSADLAMSKLVLFYFNAKPLHLSSAENAAVDVFAAWAICRDDDWAQISDVFVARELLNGTMVLANAEGEEGRILAYLVVSDSWKTGSFLLRCDQHGHIHVRLREQLRPNILLSSPDGDRATHSFLHKDRAWVDPRAGGVSAFSPGFRHSAPPDWFFSAQVDLEPEPSVVAY